MKSLIVRAATRVLMPLLLIYSVFLLLRGHNAPGGGFVGGLVAGAAFTVYAIAFGVRSARQALGVSPRAVMGGGLIAALASAFVGPLLGRPIMTGEWGTRVFPAVGKLGTPLLFDVGVYLVVLGVVLTIVLALVEE